MAVNQAAIAAQLITQLALVNGSISTVGALQEDSPIVLQTVYNAVQNALAPFLAAIAAYDADIDTTSVGSVVTGGAGPQLAAALLNQAADVAQQARLLVAQAYVSRVGVNVLNAPG
jgi:NAD-dependent oxidoreductase involved in siderophore biosynthesis